MEYNRLNIRPSVFSDCVKFAEWETDSVIRKSFTMSDDWDYERIARNFVLSDADDTKIQMTIELKNTGEAIGRVQISRIDRGYDSLDITRIYIGDEANRRKGYGEEAMRLVLEYCFIKLRMERVTLDYLDGNDGAGRLYERMGFVHEGTARHGGKKNGIYVDFHLMSMLRSEYYDKFCGKSL